MNEKMNEIDNKKVKKFLLTGKGIFLTYSQISDLEIDERDVREVFTKQITNCLSETKKSTFSGICVALEKHKDGSGHIHAYLDFSAKFETTNERYFDVLGKHPNMTSIRSREKALAYCLKEDRKAYLDDHMMNLATLWTSTARFVVEHYLSKGFGPDLTAVKMGNYGFNNVGKIKRWWLAYQASQQKQADLDKPGWNQVWEKLSYFKDDNQYQQILQPIEIAAKLGSKRPLKEKNLLLYSSNPSVGKTTFAFTLEKRVKTFDFPTDGWWDGYEDNSYDLIIWNEVNFVGWQVTELNRLFEGSSLKLPIKGAKQTKTDNPLIICTSNLNLEGLLRQKGFDSEKINFYLPILSTRITEINVGDGRLWKLVEELDRTS